MGAIRTYRKQKVCKVCGKPIPSQKRYFCSKECSNKARVLIEVDRRKFNRQMGLEVW